MTRILVTGTSGFIASHLAELLARDGHTVLGLDARLPLSAPTEWSHETCDLLDAPGLTRALQEFAPETVLHLAARADLDETQDISGYAANIEGVRNLARAIRAVGTVRRTVCTSSQLVNRIGYTPSSDEDFQPSTLYGQSKGETERIWRAEDGGDTVWVLVRPTTIWGPRMNPHYLRFFSMIRAGSYRHVSGGPRFKSYGYVGNTIRQFRQLALAPAEQVHGRVFFLADYEPLSIEGWADAFSLALGAPKIRTMPLAFARLAASVGDSINAIGVKRFPFNSFRLNNVLTSYVVDLQATQDVCGPLEFDMRAGVAETGQWLRTLWQSAERDSAG